MHWTRILSKRIFPGAKNGFFNKNAPPVGFLSLWVRIDELFQKQTTFGETVTRYVCQVMKRHIAS